MLNNADLQKRKELATPRGVGVTCPFFADHALNAKLWDVQGRRYIDFAAGIAVLNTGHRHPKVMAAIAAQQQRFVHTCYQVVPYASYVTLAERINALTPGRHAKKTAFFSSGAEAVENAVKIARAATGRSAIICFSGAFHGRTMMGMALTGKVNPYKLGFAPFPSEVYHVPFPSALHGISSGDALQAIHNLFKADVAPQRVAAILIEPVQGEGGFHQAPAELMRGLRALCDQHGMLLVADEIQTGFGRTGKLFAMEHYDVLPDLMTLAKSLAGGLPLSAVCGSAALMDAPQPGGLGGTYAGNPVAIAAAHAVLDVLEEEDLVARANMLGTRVKQHLHQLHHQVPQLADVRGPGSMVAAEFMKPGTQQADPLFTKRVQAMALERGLILLTCGNEGNVIRFLYPLTIGDELMDEALDILADVLLQAVQPEPEYA